MRIMIVGCGKVGYTIAENLSAEKHDIIALDTNDAALKKAADTLDILCIKGNGASMSVLRDAGAAKTDVLIAATGHDEINMLCCFTAKKLGVKCTVARIRDEDYVSDLRQFKRELDIDHSVNPEQTTASYISRLLRFPDAFDIDTFFRGAIELVGFRLTETDPIIGASLVDIKKRMNGIAVLFCAVEHDDVTVIPNGGTMLSAGDKIYVIGTPANINKFFRHLGRASQKVKDSFIVGGGRIATYLADKLTDANISVKIVEANQQRCLELCERLPKALIVKGDGTDQDLLNSEELENASSFVSLTGDDEDNIIMALHAKHCGVKRVIVKTNRQNYNGLADELGLDCNVSPKSITAHNIVRIVRAMQNSHGSKMEYLYRIAGNAAEAMVFSVGPMTKNTGIPFKQVKIKNGILVAVIARGTSLIIPEGGDFLQDEDKVIIISQKPILDLNDIFAE